MTIIQFSKSQVKKRATKQKLRESLQRESIPPNKRLNPIRLFLIAVIISQLGLTGYKWYAINKNVDNFETLGFVSICNGDELIKKSVEGGITDDVGIITFKNHWRPLLNGYFWARTD